MIQYANIQKQFNETKEENEDLKKRLDFMEKQQEILFSIVSESNRSRSMSHPPYQQPSIPINSIVNQIEPLINIKSDEKACSPKQSAFKPSVIIQEGKPVATNSVTNLVNPKASLTAPALLANENLNAMNPIQLCQKLNCIIRNLQ